MNNFLCAVLFISLLSIAPQAGARTFDLKTESFAAYFAGTYGSSKVGDTTFGASVATDATTDKQMSSSASGEIGFLFPGETMSLRLGFEYLLPKALAEVNMTTTSGSVLAQTNAKVTALIPMVSLEFPAFKTATSRMIVGIGGGMAFLDIENVHTLTAAGQARFPTLGTGYTESGSGSGLAAQVYTGFEFLLTDTTTMVFSGGYRYSKVSDIKSGKSQSTFYGSHQQGETLKNADGGNRFADLSSFYGSLAFRFYLGM